MTLSRAPEYPLTQDPQDLAEIQDRERMQSSISEEGAKAGTRPETRRELQSRPTPTHSHHATSQQCRLWGPSRHAAPRVFTGGWFKGLCLGKVQTPRGRGAWLAGASLVPNI